MAPPPCAAPALRGLHGRLTRLHVTASYGGGRGRGRGDAGPPGGGLIWGPSGPIRGPPGDQSSPRPPPGKLILPGQGGSPMPSRSPPMPAKMAELPDELGDIPLETALPGTINTGTAAPAPNRYRPPAGFMNEKVAEDDTSKMDPQQMLNKLQAKAGKWHALAKLLPALYSKQFDTSMVSELTGLTPAEQNLWFVASTVYDSLQASGTMAPQALARFDRPEVGPSLLYPFRFLAAERRVEAAQYIIAGDLDIEVRAPPPPLCVPCHGVGVGVPTAGCAVRHSLPATLLSYYDHPRAAKRLPNPLSCFSYSGACFLLCSLRCWRRRRRRRRAGRGAAGSCDEGLRAAHARREGGLWPRSRRLPGSQVHARRAGDGTRRGGDGAKGRRQAGRQREREACSPCWPEGGLAVGWRQGLRRDVAQCRAR